MNDGRFPVTRRGRETWWATGSVEKALAGDAIQHEQDERAAEREEIARQRERLELAERTVRLMRAAGQPAATRICALLGCDQPVTSKRADARYCSDAHRAAANRTKRRSR